MLAVKKAAASKHGILDEDATVHDFFSLLGQNQP
jgi:hypothetical protein